jgi:hypothetical protein
MFSSTIFHALPVGRKRRTIDPVGMAFQLRDHLPGGGIPHPRRLILARRHNALPVGRKCRTKDFRGMAFQLRQFLSK